MLAERPPVHAVASFPLTCAARGETVDLVEIRAGDGMRKRLLDLGLKVGAQVRVVQEGNGGPIILAVHNDSRLALGPGMAQKIMVQPHLGDS